MRADVWKRVEELFEAALREPPERRDEFLRHACPDDPELLREVLSLLDSSDTASTFLEDRPITPVEQRPRLNRGHKLGHFEMLELIGRGGMGDVYRARDPHLKRDVAVKILPAEFGRDAARVTRFEREARASSSLNHSNILHIYDIGQTDGIYWIASELVRGETLRLNGGARGGRGPRAAPARGGSPRARHPSGPSRA